MNDIEAQRVVTMLVSAFPSALARLSDEQLRDTMKIYREMIKDVEADLAAQAVRGLIATSRFMPTIAEVREACMIAKYGRRRPGGDAWGDVVKALKRYGYTRSPGRDFSFDDQLVARAVGALGWAELCKSDNSVADRARFIELYDQLANNVRSDAQVSSGVTSRELGSGAPRLERGASLRELLPAPGDEK
jgi:hypothetical protein